MKRNGIFFWVGAVVFLIAIALMTKFITNEYPFFAGYVILQFGVDQRSVTAPYIGKAWRIGDMRIPYRLVVAFAVATLLTTLLALYLSKTFMGRAIRAVAQDQEALRLMGADPVRVKQWAFGVATAVLGIAGAQEAPNSVSTMVSAMPRMMAATSVPLMLPSPAMTTTQKDRPI